MRFTGVCSIGVLVVASCGPVRSGDDLGEPLFTLRGQLRGALLPKPEGEYRAVYGWVSFGGGPYVDCLATAVSPLLECNPAMGYDTALLLKDATVRAIFPASIEIDFFAFPDASALLDYKGSIFMLGGVAIYDDRNLDSSLNQESSVGAGDGDILVAESVFFDWRSSAVFREGPLHPINWSLNRVLGCNEPRQGFSVGKVEGVGECTVDSSNELMITISSPDAIARARCGGQIATLNVVDRPQPPQPLPDNAVVTCQPGNSLRWYADEGDYCDQFRVTQYALVGRERIMGRVVEWDQLDVPPADWPCPIDR